MTAKEMATKAKDKELRSGARRWYNYYRFTPAEFREFCEQHAKEQRELCQQEFNKRSTTIIDESGTIHWYVHCEDVMNTPSPEVEKKGDKK